MQDALKGAVTLRVADEARTGDRAGIDHRIERQVGGVQPNRVEGIAARLDTDRRFDSFRADRLERQREDEGLGNRLDGERHQPVAHLVHVAVDGGDADAEMRRIRLGQFRDVIRQLAAEILRELAVAAPQKS